MQDEGDFDPNTKFRIFHGSHYNSRREFYVLYQRKPNQADINDPYSLTWVPLLAKGNVEKNWKQEKLRFDFRFLH